MHDLTHSSTFSKRWMNEWAAAVTALMNPVDPADYKRVHSQHHAHTGMEVRKGGGDISLRVPAARLSPL
jgi:fatty acid desaturase